MFVFAPGVQVLDDAMLLEHVHEIVGVNSRQAALDEETIRNAVAFREL